MTTIVNIFHRTRFALNLLYLLRVFRFEFILRFEAIYTESIHIQTAHSIGQRSIKTADPRIRWTVGMYHKSVVHAPDPTQESMPLMKRSGNAHP